jgi:hypothetical protein
MITKTLGRQASRGRVGPSTLFEQASDDRAAASSNPDRTSIEPVKRCDMPIVPPLPPDHRQYIRLEEPLDDEHEADRRNQQQQRGD